MVCPNRFTGFQNNGDSDTVHCFYLTGRTKVMIKTMKNIHASWNRRYLEENRLCRALFKYRNKPSAKDGQSPAQKLYGHLIQDTILVHDWSLDSTWQCSKEEAKDKAVTTSEKATMYYNHQLLDITEGSHVAIQHPCTKLWDTYGIVTFVRSHRQYYVKTKIRTVLKCNQRYTCTPNSSSIHTSTGKGAQDRYKTSQHITLLKDSHHNPSHEKLHSHKNPFNG